MNIIKNTAVFFNCDVSHYKTDFFDFPGSFQKDSSHAAYLCSRIGTFFFTPIRYLFDGKIMYFALVPADPDPKTPYNSNIAKNRIRLCANMKEFSYNKQEEESKAAVASRKTGLRTALAISCFIPGIILGIPFKLCSMLSLRRRDLHELAVEKYSDKVSEEPWYTFPWHA